MTDCDCCFQYMTFPIQSSEKLSLVPVIAMLLQFSRKERRRPTRVGVHVCRVHLILAYARHPDIQQGAQRDQAAQHRRGGSSRAMGGGPSAGTASP